MRKYILVVIAIILPLITFAHEGNKSFFKIEQKETTVEVIAEFPWTIRNALLGFAPELKNSKSQEDFDTAFFEYIKSSFILRDLDGNQLELLTIKDIRLDGHSHQNDFLFTFKGTSFNTVLNHISFNLTPSQINHHTIAKGYDFKTFETTHKHPYFEISNEHNASFGYLWLLLIVPIAFGIYLKKNNTFKLY